MIASTMDNASDADDFAYPDQPSVLNELMPSRPVLWSGRMGVMVRLDEEAHRLPKAEMS